MSTYPAFLVLRPLLRPKDVLRFPPRRAGTEGSSIRRTASRGFPISTVSPPARPAARRRTDGSPAFSRTSPSPLLPRSAPTAPAAKQQSSTAALICSVPRRPFHTSPAAIPSRSSRHPAVRHGPRQSGLFLASRFPFFGITKHLRISCHMDMRRCAAIIRFIPGYPRRWWRWPSA